MENEDVILAKKKKTRLAAIWLEVFLSIQKKMTEHALLLF